MPKEIVPISICGKAPDWYTGIQYKVLAPKYEFFKVWQQTRDNEYYIKCFNEQVLNKLNAQAVYKRLTELSDGRDIALVCYEKPGDFCHRHLVADWLSSNLGIECEEYILQD